MRPMETVPPSPGSHLVASMGTDLPTELLALKAAVKAAGATTGPMSMKALEQSCHVIDLVIVEMDQLRRTLVQHLHLRAVALAAARP